MSKRRICVVTGTRAEYGLLRWVMEGIRAHEKLELLVVATGMHLSPEFGLTYREIEADGYNVDRKVEMLLSSDTAVGVGKAMGLAMIGFADALAELEPDILVVLGDRFEIFPAVAAAMVARIPVAHVHGGEATEGLIDESIRHSISKMAQLHFVATAEYRRRVVQLGESPERVFEVGGLGVDAIRRTTLMGRDELQRELNLTFGERALLVTFHPVTLECATAGDQMRELLAALDRFPDVPLIFTMPNADTDGRVLINMVEQFVANRAGAYAFTSLGQRRYLSCLAYARGVVGNSSSGLCEAPSFHIGTVNIGDRQRGRLKAGSVIDCLPERESIAASIRKLFSPEFARVLQSVKNPYGDGGASERIVDVLANVQLDAILKKKFYDLPMS